MRLRIFRFCCALSLILGLTACGPNLFQGGEFSTLNSSFTDEQPGLSGDGRLVAFVSNRAGRQDLALYDLQAKQFIPLPRLNRANALVESPSLTRTGRYIVYLSSAQGRTEVELYDRITRRIQILTIRHRGLVRNPSISPDGRYVTFVTGRRGQWDIEVLDRGRIELDLPQGNRTITTPLSDN
jgi:Tol biopolymer transport system component